jgi:hypothetical protein
LRCGSLGQTDAGLITIGELTRSAPFPLQSHADLSGLVIIIKVDAGFLKRPLDLGHRRNVSFDQASSTFEAADRSQSSSGCLRKIFLPPP